MATRPSFPPGQGQAALQQELEQLLSSDLASMTLGQLLGMTLSSLCMGERQAHLRGDASDSGNGFYEHGVQVGSVPVSMSVPRTRKSEFRPAVLPEPYQRGYPQQMEELLLGLLGSSRSIEGVRRSLRSLGMAVPEDILQDTIDTLSQELELLNSGTLDPDLAVVFMDAKHIEVRIGKRLAKAAIYTCVGIDLEGRKRVLACHVREGPESFGQWKETLRSLLDRGLRRVLLRVQDAFPGLVGLSEGLFPQAEVQFCTVHMLRNARKHLSKKDFRIFHAGWKGVRNAWDPELGARRFEDLCSQFEDRYGTWIAYLRKNRRCLLAFLGYPSRVRASLATTNTAEAVNGQLEILRRNSGGYFQSRRSLQCKLALAVRQLHEVRWKSPVRTVCAELPALQALFRQRFEDSRQE